MSIRRSAWVANGAVSVPLLASMAICACTASSPESTASPTGDTGETDSIPASTVNWERDLGAELGSASPLIRGDLAAGAGVVFAGVSGLSSSDSAYLVAMDANDGTVRWMYEVLSIFDSQNNIEGTPVYEPVSGFTLVTAGVFGGSGMGRLAAVDAAGNAAWDIESEGRNTMFWNPLVVDGAAYIAVEGELWKFDVASGAVGWVADLTRAIFERSAPAHDAEHDLIAVAEYERIQGFGRATGAELWHVDGATFDFYALVAIDGRIVSVSAGQSDSGFPEDATLRAYDGEDGSLLWEVSRPECLYTALAVSGGALLQLGCGPTQNGVTRIDPSDGHVLWEYYAKYSLADSQGSPHAPRALGNDLYVGTDYGFCVLDLDDGTLQTCIDALDPGGTFEGASTEICENQTPLITDSGWFCASSPRVYGFTLASAGGEG